MLRDGIVLKIEGNITPETRVAQVPIDERIEFVDVPIHDLTSDFAHGTVKVFLVIEKDEATAREASHELW